MVVIVELLLSPVVLNQLHNGGHHSHEENHECSQKLNPGEALFEYERVAQQNINNLDVANERNESRAVRLGRNSEKADTHRVTDCRSDHQSIALRAHVE